MEETHLPHSDIVLAEERECDFAGALAALHELIGHRVTVTVTSTGGSGHPMPIAISGTLARGTELARNERAPILFELDPSGYLSLLPRWLECAWREVWRRDDEHEWLCVWLRFRGGTEVEVEQLPGALG
jgi:hypothetical protein